MRKYYIYIIILVSVISSILIYTFTFLDSPTLSRQKTLDNTRRSDLMSLDSYVQNYYSVNSKLPTSIQDLSSLGSYATTNIYDPATHNPYNYSVVSPTSYKLCATFDLDYTDSGTSIYTPYAAIRNTKGYYCYTSTVSSSILKPPIVK